MIEIREEKLGDAAAIREVNRMAFDRDAEGRIVDALRASGSATVSLVAVDDDLIVGHIMFSPVFAGTEKGAGLGPMAVAPGYQKRGIGSRLVNTGIDRLRDHGCAFIVVIGHSAFYPRFGFAPAASHGLTCDWNVPEEAFMVKILTAAYESRVRGRVQYRAEFGSA